MTRTFSAFAAVGVLLAVTASTRADLPLGIVADKPAEGRAVLIEDGEHKGKWMVPYTHAIRIYNNQTIKIQFEPIPGGDFVMGSPETEKDRNKEKARRCACASSRCGWASTR